jgi:hypothetical protein
MSYAVVTVNCDVLLQIIVARVEIVEVWRIVLKM